MVFLVAWILWIQKVYIRCMFVYMSRYFLIGLYLLDCFKSSDIRTKTVIPWTYTKEFLIFSQQNQLWYQNYIASKSKKGNKNKIIDFTSNLISIIKDWTFLVWGVDQCTFVVQKGLHCFCIVTTYYYLIFICTCNKERMYPHHAIQCDIMMMMMLMSNIFLVTHR